MDLWVNKYSPKTPRQVAGNPKAVKDVFEWVNNFNCKQKMKILLLIGKPGVGKTSTVTAVANVLKRELKEFNASDTRTPKMLKDLLFDTGSLKSYFDTTNNQFGKNMSSQSQIILMDEVDGMQASAVSELILLAEKSKWPVLCICNVETPAVRKLATKSDKVRFYSISKSTIVSFAQSILKKENQFMSEEELIDLVEYTDGDMRKTINELQFICTNRTNNCSRESGENTNMISEISEDTIFNMVQKLINSNVTVEQMIQYYFADSFFVPLFVQENYLNAIQIHSKSKLEEDLKRITDIADSLSQSDLVQRNIYQYQNFELEPLRAYLSTVIPVTLMNKHVGRVNFPISLGKMKTQEKYEKFIQDLRKKSFGKLDQDSLYYVTLMMYFTLKTKGSPEGVNLVVDWILEFNIDIDDYKELFVLTDNEDLFKGLETKVKSAVTREYKKRTDIPQSKKRKLIE